MITPPRILLCFLVLILTWNTHANTQPQQHAIATAHPLATEAGMAILRKGGNAFDAAVTVSAVLGVVEPYSSGLGGGGFWLLHRANDGKQVMIDGRETAPLAAHRDMYLDKSGEPIPKLSIDGPLAAGIPGAPAALAHIAEQYGVLPLQKTLAPAIKLAREGFMVDAYYRRMASFRLTALRADHTSAQQFLLEHQIPPKNHRLRQPDLANTLQALAESGRDGFYAGEVARKLVTGVRQAGGIWTLQDLQRYQIIERQPLIGQYQNARITSASLPSSGGVVLMQMLNMLGHFDDLDQQNPADRTHLLVETMRRAYQDRARYLGDSDFVDVPLNHLLSPVYAKQQANSIDRYKASISSPMTAGKPEGADTTHFSIIDQQGNRVAATLSINYPFGACFVPPGTGVLLNDEMDDFSIKPGAPNAYGLVGNQANAIEPGKRMLSSMSPTFVETENQVTILGTPGGSRIISMVLLGALEAIKQTPVETWVNTPRFHHQYLPDAIQFEPHALSENTIIQLRSKGHKLKPLNNQYGNMQAIIWNKRTNKMSAASDHRGIGKAVIFPATD